MLVARFSLGSMPQLFPCAASHVSKYIGANQGQGEFKAFYRRSYFWCLLLDLIRQWGQTQPKIILIMIMIIIIIIIIIIISGSSVLILFDRAGYIHVFKTEIATWSTSTLTNYAILSAPNACTQPYNMGIGGKRPYFRNTCEGKPQ